MKTMDRRALSPLMATLIFAIAFLGITTLSHAHLSIIRQGAESRGAKETGDEHGRAVAVGDFNGDGFQDLAVGAPKEDVGTTVDAGMVVINYGSALGLTHVGADYHTAETMGQSLRTGALLGSAVVAADFDHDGYDDLVIGAPGEQVVFAAGAGRVYVLEGGPSGLSFRVAWSQSDAGGTAESGDRFGEALAAGNWNGDAAPFMDLAVGAPGEDDAAGAVFTFHGSSVLFLSADDSFTAADFSSNYVIGAEVGSALATGNFVSTGHDDLAIGAPGLYIGSNAAAGAVFLVRGTSAGLALNGYPRYAGSDIDAGTAAGRFGLALAGGKFRSGSYDALAIGEPGHNHPGYNTTGRVLVLSGGSTGLDVASAIDLRHCEFSGTCGSLAFFGWSLAAGHFATAGGTYDDLAIGAPGVGSEFGTPSAGAVYVIEGGANGPTGQYGWAGFTQPNLGEQFEAYDKLGDGVAFGSFDDSGKGALVATAPGEDLDATTTDIGLVHIIAPWRQVINLSCEYSVALDCEDKIVFSQKPFDRVSIASTTKAMTVLLAAERSQLPPNDPLYISLNEPYVVPAWVANDVYGSQVPLVEGETITLRELMWTCIMVSGNDAACAIADLAGQGYFLISDYSEFMDAMNDRAAALGMNGTHFHNPAGLDEPPVPYSGGHYSTPYDMALLSRAAMENDIIREIVGSDRFDMTRRFGTPGNCDYEPWEFLNIFRGVLNNDILAANGIKGGETGNAKRTGLFSANAPGQGDAIACTFRTDPSAGWPAYIDDAAHLLQLGAAECNFDFTYLGAMFAATWFNEFHLDPGCRTGGSTGTFPGGGAGDMLLRSYHSGGGEPLGVQYDVHDVVEVSIPYFGSTELGVAPFRSHGDVRIANHGSETAIVLVTPSVGGTAQQHTIAPGNSVTLAPFTAGFTLPDFDLVIQNLHTAQTDADLTIEATYGYDLALGAPNLAMPFHTLTLKRPPQVVSGSVQIAYTPDHPSPGTRLYVAVGDQNATVDAPEAEMAAVDGPISAHAATPNPFVTSTRITFDLPQASEVGAEIYDALGRRVRVLEDRALDGGRWALDWDGRDAGGIASPSGVYFYRLRVQGRDAVSGKVIRTN